MSIEQLRVKYRQILEQPESEQSQEEQQDQYTVLKQNRKKRILTQANENYNSRCVTFTDKLRESVPVSAHLNVKEKLAQSIANLTEKDQEIDKLRKENAKTCNGHTKLQGQISALNTKIQQLQKTLIDQKVAYASLSKQKSELLRRIQTDLMDRQLVQKQIQFYKTEINNLRSSKKSLKKKMQNIEQQMKTVDQVRNENSRLKDDIKRLHLILNDANKQTQKGSLLKKHFFGKPYREFELWYPTNIVGECEFFLKKEQIGCGNKDFLANLVKFVVNCMERSRNKDGKNARNSCCSKISQVKRNTSIDYDLSHSTLRRTQKLGSSLLRNSLHHLSGTEIQDSKICTMQSFIYDKLQSSLSFDQGRKLRQSICEILQEFKVILWEMLAEKELRKRKIMKLFEEMNKSLLSVFDSIRMKQEEDKQRAAIMIKT